MKYKYPVSQPDLSGKEKEYVNEALESGWISSAGKYVQEFEKLFAHKHVGTDLRPARGVACSSGTNGLILALRALGVKAGDEVIVPEFTMVASAWAVSMCGANPVFVDCTFEGLIDPAKIEAAITEKTKAIMPVHIYGRQCDMDKIMTIAHDYGLRVVEDSCEAHGVAIRGDIAVYSLYGNKIITAGEGGICITKDSYLADQMEHLRGMAFEKNHTFLHKKLGYNFRMTNLQAAVALAQTERLEEFLEKRRQIEEWYNEGLKDLGITRPSRKVLWMYDISVSMHDREDLRAFLESKGIETRLFFKPMSMQPMYFNPEYMRTVAYKLSLEGFYLPTYTSLQKEDVEYICGAIKEFYERKKTKESATRGKSEPESEAPGTSE